MAADPADGTRLASAPSRVHLEFNLLVMHGTWVTVSGPSGVVASGEPLIAGFVADQPLPGNLPDGTYSVQYYADFIGASASGTLHFAVGPAPAPSTPAVAPSRTATASPARRAPRPGPTPTGGTATGPATRSPNPAQGTATAIGVPATPSRTGGSAAGSAAKSGPGTGATTASGAASAPSTSSTGGWLPPPVVLLALATAGAGFAADRFRTARRDRTGLRHAAVGSPTTP